MQCQSIKPGTSRVLLTVSMIKRYVFLGLFLFAGLTSGAAAAPEVTSPVPGSTLSGSTETFQWTGAWVEEWWLYVGTSMGGTDLYDSGSLGGRESTTVGSLPEDGSTVWVRLWYRTDGLWYLSDGWHSIDYQYTAAAAAGTEEQVTAAAAAGTGEPVVVAPVTGSRLSGSSETFQWSANGASVEEWWLYVGTSVGGSELHDSGSLGSNVSTTVESLPEDGSTVWVRLWYLTDDWYSVDYQYTAAAGGGTDTGGTTGGATGSFNLGWTAPVSRTDGSQLSLSDIDGFKVYYGTSPGNYTHYIDVSAGSAQSVTVRDVPVGTYYVVMTTYDSDGRESSYSSRVTKTVL